MSITDFLLARIADDENEARALLDDLEAECERNWKGVVDERGPMTPQRLLKSQMWAHFAGQTRERNFAKGQHIATLANPARVLAECAAKRAIISMWTPTDLESEDRGAYFYAGGLGDAVKALASIYADHPDFQQEWHLENTEPLN